MALEDDTIPWIGPEIFRPPVCTIANDPGEGAYGNDETLVVMTFDELSWPEDAPVTNVPEVLPAVPPGPVLLLKALDEIEKTGPLIALVVVIVVDVSAETLWTRPIAPEDAVVAGWEEAGDGVTRS